MIAEIAVHQLRLTGLAVIVYEAAPMYQYDQRHRFFTVRHIQIQIVIFGSLRIWQLLISFSTIPFGRIIQFH